MIGKLSGDAPRISGNFLESVVGESWLEAGLKESWLRLEGEGGRMVGWLGDEVWNFPEC